MTKKTEELMDAPEATGVKLDEWAEEWVERYMTIWRKAYSLLPTGMKDEEAKAGAINGMMIGADRHGLLKAMPVATPVPEKKAEVVAGKGDGIPCALASSPYDEGGFKNSEIKDDAAAEAFLKAEEESEKRKEKAVTKDGGTPAQEQKKSEKAPAKEQTALPKEGIPLGADGNPLLPYDRNKPGWNYCPICNNRNITHPKNKPKTGDYQACWECRVWLPADSDKPKPMDQEGGR